MLPEMDVRVVEVDGGRAVGAPALVSVVSAAEAGVEAGAGAGVGAGAENPHAIDSVSVAESVSATEEGGETLAPAASVGVGGERWAGTEAEEEGEEQGEEGEGEHGVAAVKVPAAVEVAGGAGVTAGMRAGAAAAAVGRVAGVPAPDAAQPGGGVALKGDFAVVTAGKNQFPFRFKRSRGRSHACYDESCLGLANDWRIPGGSVFCRALVSPTPGKASL